MTARTCAAIGFQGIDTVSNGAGDTYCPFSYVWRDVIRKTRRYPALLKSGSTESGYSTVGMRKRQGSNEETNGSLRIWLER